MNAIAFTSISSPVSCKYLPISGNVSVRGRQIYDNSAHQIVGLKLVACCAPLAVIQRRRWRLIPKNISLTLVLADSDGCEPNASSSADAETNASTPSTSSGKRKSSSGLCDKEQAAKVEELEGKLHKSVQNEDFEVAATLRDELMMSQVDDEGSVLLANTQLYDCFNRRDLKTIKALWLQAPFVQCVHPFDKRASGYAEVCASWERLFQVFSKKTSVSFRDIRVNVRGTTATVTCTEQISSASGRRAAPPVNMFATNIFGKVDGKWFLVHRHVSPPGDANLVMLEPGESGEENPRSEAFMAALMARMRESAPFPFLARIVIEPGMVGGGYGDDDSDDEAPFQVMSGNGFGTSNDEVDSNSEEEDDSDDDEYLDERDEMEDAQETVRALRKLHKEGHLTQQAKLQLLAEMVKNPGESMPERAHRLLMSDVPEDEKQAAWEDFAALVALQAKRYEVPKAPPHNPNQRQGKNQHEKK